MSTDGWRASYEAVQRDDVTGVGAKGDPLGPVGKIPSSMGLNVARWGRWQLAPRASGAVPSHKSPAFS